MAEELFQTNVSTNATNCHGDYCVESTLYRKVMGTIIFVVVWPFIVLDIKKFPLGRPAAALIGAALMVLFVVVPQEQVYVVLGERGNLQTLFLLIGMMMLSYYYDREGMLQYVTLWIFGKSKPFKHVLWKVCVLSAVLSAIITNDATCLVLTPLLLTEHMKQDRPKKEYPPLLLGIATSANIGSAATFFGNPQNAFIAANSSGQVSLLIFMITALPAAIIGLLISVFLLYLCYFRTIWPKRGSLDDGEGAVRELNGRANGIPAANGVTTPSKRNGDIHQVSMSLAASRDELALSYDKSVNPLATSLASKERTKLYNGDLNGSTPVHHHQNGFAGRRKENGRRRTAETETSYGGNSCSSTSSQEYGATTTTTRHTNNHLHNHVLSGRASRLNTRSSDRFGSSMKMSNNPVLMNSNKNVTEEISDPSVGLVEAEEMETAVEKRANWRQRVFVSWLVIITCILVILLAIPPPPVVTAEFNLGLVPVGAGVMTMLVDTILNKKYAHDAMIKVDWTMILMFMGLFIWLCGFENTLFPSDAFKFIRQYMDLYTIQGVLVFTIFVVIGSNILSNVPLVILIMDQLANFKCGGDDYCSGQLTGMLLAWVSTIAGNFTLIGSVANLIVAEKGRNIADYRLSFWEYLKFGFCSTMMVLFAGLPIVYFAAENVRI